MPVLSLDSSIESVAVYRVKTQFAQPLRLSRGLLSEKLSLMLHWQHDGGDCWTECSPLPEFSCETLSDCLQQIQERVLPLLPVRLIDLTSQCPPLFAALDFAVCGLECLAKPWVKPESIHRCRLLTAGESADALKGAACVKIKVGVRSLEKDIAFVESLSQMTGFHGRMRFDANQQWSFADAVRFANAVNPEVVDWIEEPLSRREDYRRWAKTTELSFALDENLYQNNSTPCFIEGLRALILKPTLLGYRRTLQLADWAAQNVCRVVFSSSFETGVGMQCLTQLAGSLAPEEYHGFDTLKYLFTDFRQSDPRAFTCNLERVL